MDEADLDRLELEDQVQEVGKLTPREYARLRHMVPQNVYYHLRKGLEEFQVEICICGRKVIDVKKADKYFGFNQDDG